MRDKLIDYISHHIRQPLMQSNAVIMNLEKLIEKKDCEAIKENLDELIEINKQISQFIESLKKG